MPIKQQCSNKIIPTSGVTETQVSASSCKSFIFGINLKIGSLGTTLVRVSKDVTNIGVYWVIFPQPHWGKL